MVSTQKANYKSYEAQARMVRAIVAAHPEVKWNYKEISACYGSDMTEHALNHRFRRLRAQSTVIRIARDNKIDIKDMLIDEKKLPATQEKVDSKNIAKYFGQSTADGIQFQFRSIKKDAEKLRSTTDQGGDAASCLRLGSGSATSTPTKTPTRKISSKPRSGASMSTGKRSRKAVEIKRSSTDEENDSEEDGDDWKEEMDYDSPSKRSKAEPAYQENSLRVNGTSFAGGVSTPSGFATGQYHQPYHISSESSTEQIHTPAYDATYTPVSNLSSCHASEYARQRATAQTMQTVHMHNYQQSTGPSYSGSNFNSLYGADAPYNGSASTGFLGNVYAKPEYTNEGHNDEYDDSLDDLEEIDGEF